MSKAKPTLAEVAKAAGVSATAASFALNSKGRGIPQATADRVWKAAAALGYAKPSLAKLRGWTRVAYLTAKIEYFNSATSFFANVYSNLQRLAVKSRFELFLMEFDALAADAERERRVQEMIALGIEVVLTNSRANIKPLQARGFKAVLVQSGVMPDCICVHCDDHEAGRLAAVHALANGHNAVGTIFFPGLDTHQRFIGFVKGMKEGKGQLLDKFHWTVPTDHSKAAEKIARLAAGKKRLPSLFYCFADNIVFPAIRGLAQAGLRVPDDVSLIGTDNLYWGAHATPAFTTVDLLEDIFAKRLVEAVKDAVAGESQYSIASPVRLIARETVRRLS